MLAVIYAFVAGLKKVVDFDLGWQMATARYIWDHQTIPSVDVFSYTAAGSPWIYPILSGFFFLAAFKLGGYAAVSWLSLLVCVGTTAICSFRRTAWTSGLTILAVPIFAEQTIPRSGMFTVLLFAAFARLLFDHFQRGSGPLWLLPVLMLVWVNVHLGFIAGLALLAAYLFLELAEFPFPHRRPAALKRLGRAWPWILATLNATFLNPWGWKIWTAVYEQEFPSRTEQIFVQEFASLRPLVSVMEWRNPMNAVYWLMVIALIGALTAFWQKQFGAAIVLVLAVFATLDHARISGPFAALVCLLAGPELNFAWIRSLAFRKVEWAAAALLSILVVVRCTDLLSDRFYLSDGQITLSGAGASWWMPERATDFLLANHLPGEVFSTFNLSSYLVWKLYSRHRDFADGRYIPFGDKLFYEQRALAQAPLDAPIWKRVAAQRNIRTIIYPLAPLLALGDIPLQADCASSQWSPVYIDLSAIIFVRRDSLPESMLNRASQGCNHLLKTGVGEQLSRAERYQQLTTLAGIHYLLGRVSDARQALTKAEQITDIDSTLFLQKGELAMSAGNFVDAARNFHLSISRLPSEPAWNGLGVVYMNQKRYPEAIDALKESARLAGQERYQALYQLGKAYVVAGQPEEGLRVLNRSLAISPFGSERVREGAEFRAGISDARAAAYFQLGDLKSANMEQQAAVEQTPDNPTRWQLLAQTYLALGLKSEAEKAQQKANTFRK